LAEGRLITGYLFSSPFYGGSQFVPLGLAGYTMNSERMMPASMKCRKAVTTNDPANAAIANQWSGALFRTLMSK